MSVMSLDTSGTLGDGFSAVAQIVEWLVEGIEEVFDVLLEDTSLVHVDSSDVALDDVGVRTTEEISSTIAECVRVNNVVAILVVSTGSDGVSAADIGGNVSQDGKTSGRSTTEPIGSEGLVTEDGTESIGGQLGGGTVSEEFEDESDFREGGENTGDVELEILVFLLILNESVVFEFLEDFVVDNREFAVWAIITEATDVVQESIEEVVLEVYAVADVNVTTSGGNITFETTVHGNTTSDGTIKLAWRGRDIGSRVSNGNPSDVWVTASQGGE